MENETVNLRQIQDRVNELIALLPEDTEVLARGTPDGDYTEIEEIEIAERCNGPLIVRIVT